MNMMEADLGAYICSKNIKIVEVNEWRPAIHRTLNPT